MSVGKPSISFVVPALNEVGHIEKTLETIQHALADSQISNYEIILVTDGSTDGTGQTMDRLAGQKANVRAVHNPRNLGFGAAYKRGVAEARCDYVMIIAGDNLMPASSITMILNRLGDADIILPYMTDRHLRPMVRRIGSWGFTTLINLLFGHRIRYYNSMVPRRDLLNRVTIHATGYSMQAECIVKMLRVGATYAEIPVPHGHGVVKGGSHALRLKNLVNLFKGIVALRGEIRRSSATTTATPVNNPAPAKRDL